MHRLPLLAAALRWLLAAPPALLLAACGGAPAPPQAAAPPAAFALLTSLDADAVAEAYRRLDGYAYTAEVRLTTEDAAGRRAASRTLARRPTRDGVAERLLATASTGAFGEGAWGARLLDPLPRLLPDEPPFLAPHSREQYRYAIRPDSVVDGRRLLVIEVRLRPAASGEQAVRLARFLLDPERDRVLGVEVERTSTSALFDEAGRAAVYLRSGPDGAPLPAYTLVETTVDVAGEAPRRLRLEQRFRDVRRAEWAP